MSFFGLMLVLCCVIALVLYALGGGLLGVLLFVMVAGIIIVMAGA